MDREFHDLILEVTGNHLLLEAIWDSRVRTQRTFAYALHRRLEDTVREHTLIAKAILKRDAAFAEELMRKHIDDSITHLTQP